MVLALALQQGPQLAQRGRVKVVYWPPSQRLALSLAETANAATRWPGLPGEFRDSLTILLAPNSTTFDSLTQGRLPEWGAAGAFPEVMTIVLSMDETPAAVLRHELAHLALHSTIAHPPLWLSEGYAVWAAGEWGRLDQLRLNLALVAGNVPTLGELSRQLREGRARATSAYGLAATTVVTLDRIAGDDGLERLIASYAETGNLDAALRTTFLITIEQFEESWQKEIRSRYGWLSLITSFTVFWLFVAVLVGGLWLRRRRRDKLRRRDLEFGWVIEGQPPSSELD